MNKNILALMPVFVFMIIMLIVSIYVRRASAKKASEGFVKDYFIGSRSLGGFVLAMTTVATYSSVSSFVGGPGQAWSIGFGWIYMSVVQVTALLLVLGILGKKMAMVSRKIDAVTIIDVIRHRYQSDVLANISAIIIVIFFAATMVAQFVGGAKLFEAVTGYSYLTGLIVFGLVVVIYTTVGGFRGVAITDAICAVVMLAGMVILLIGIIRQGGGYIAAPSANTSGRPSPTTAQHVYEDLQGKIPMILDGGAVGIGIESTIIDLSEEIPMILRPGYITKDMLAEVIGAVKDDPGFVSTDPNVHPKAPGMKYRHYAPKANLIIVSGEAEAVVMRINELTIEHREKGEKVGIICTDESRAQYIGDVIESIGSRQDEDSIAQHLYAILRDFDEMDVNVIFSESFATPRIGHAIMNRLLKAAGHQVIEV